MLTINGARSCFRQPFGAITAHLHLQSYIIQMMEVKIEVWNKRIDNKSKYNGRHL